MNEIFGWVLLGLSIPAMTESIQHGHRHRRLAVTMEDMKLVSDASLVVAIGRWQQDALAEAYRRHSGSVFALARGVLRTSAMAEEVVQEIFMRLWNSPERFDPERGSLRSWLLAQAHGRAIDIVRADNSRRRREERDYQRAAISEYDIQTEVEHVIVAEHIRDAMSSLNDGERRAIELAYFGGHSYREVATMLGEPEGTIKSRIRSGLVGLRQGLVKAGIEQL